jgi:hypothetical protein
MPSKTSSTASNQNDDLLLTIIYPQARVERPTQWHKPAGGPVAAAQGHMHLLVAVGAFLPHKMHQDTRIRLSGHFRHLRSIDNMFSHRETQSLLSGSDLTIFGLKALNTLQSGRLESLLDVLTQRWMILSHEVSLLLSFTPLRCSSLVSGRHMPALQSRAFMQSYTYSSLRFLLLLATFLEMAQ